MMLDINSVRNKLMLHLTFCLKISAEKVVLIKSCIVLCIIDMAESATPNSYLHLKQIRIHQFLQRDLCISYLR